MTIHLTHANVWVHDQEEALAFYTEKLGLEIREDVTLPELGGYRWLTVGPVGQPDVAFTLNVPGPPMFDPATTEQLKDVMAKGAMGGFILGTENCQASYEELKARGVEFTEEPSERPYGIDAGFRDPSGNSFRLVQTTM
jgi:catechol 2,3-dioxygenase-like lactoylglutathione lyase family enzyme